MTNNEKPRSDEPENQDSAAQELLDHRDLQNAQVISMMHVWDNPDDDLWETMK